MTQIIELDGCDWLDEHRTCDRTALRILKVVAQPTGDLAADLAERSATIGAMMDYLAAQPDPIAITGSGWSQSDLFSSPAIRVDTAQDRAIWPVPLPALSPDCSPDPARLVMVTGGAKMTDVMQFLDTRGLSMRTAGTHKGQSIAGAIATGTHGSLLGESGIETHVRGLLFINGSGSSHWIADPDCPVLREDFVQTFATPSDPAMFCDALIHLGGMGYCGAVLIEAVPRFELSWAKCVTPLPDGWWDAVHAGDFDSATADLCGGHCPAFYELTFDPNASLDDDVMQTVYWREQCPEDPEIAAQAQAERCPRDAHDILMDRLNAFSDDLMRTRRESSTAAADDAGFEPWDFLDLGGPIRLLNIPDMIFDDFRRSIGDQPCSNVPQSLMALTHDWKPRSVLGIRIDTFNAAFCVPRALVREALEIGLAIAPRFRRHFVYTVRFATRSRGAMSFLRFDECAVINVDGLTRAGMAGWISHSDEAASAFAEALQQADVPFAMHWGKDIPSDAAKIAADFGPAADRWKAARAALVPAALCDRLASPMLKHWGLA